jgi:hypothetical protein
MVINGKSIVVTEAHQGAGGVTYWSLADTTDSSRLEQEWVARGLDPELLPDLPGPEVALRRAAKDQVRPHRLVRRLPDGGWAIVDELVGNADQEALDYRVGLEVHLDAIGRPRFDNLTGNEPIAAEVQAAFDASLKSLSTEDIAGWLVKRVYAAGAVALRPTGGFYYVPPTTLPGWQQVAAAVCAASDNAVYDIPAMRTDSVVRAVLDGLQAEMGAYAAKLEEQVAAGTMGEQALRSRAADCERQLAKLEQYDSILGSGLDAIRQRMDDLKAAVVSAVMQAEADAAEKDAK